MLGKLRIGPKLLLAPALMLVLLLLSSSGAYYALLRQQQAFEIIVHQRAARIHDAGELVSEAQQAHSRVYQLLAWTSASFPAGRVGALERDIGQRLLGIERRLIALAASGGGDGASAGAEARYLEQARAAHLLYVQAIGDVIEIAQFDNSISANAMSKAERAFGVVAQRLAALAALEQELSRRASAGAADDFATVSTLMPLLLALSVVLSLAVTMAVRRALLREVRAISDAAFDLASGDLTDRKREYGSDEISDTSRVLDASIRNLNLTLKTILASARSIDHASREIALGNAELSQRAGAQAGSASQGASSMEALGLGLGQTVDSAAAANRLAGHASDHAQQGGGVVDQLAGTMAGIKGGAQRVLDLAAVLDKLACQTNLLALNAALEAGRCGGAGAAVAQAVDEVRLLAQRSGGAAREIRQLMTQALGEIDGGRASAAEAGQRMAAIASSVQQVGDMICQIGQASAKQASGISEVSEAIVQMDQMTRQHCALVNDAAAAARSLQQQALGLSRAVACFKLDETTVAPAMAPVPAPRDGKPHLRLASRRG